MAAPVLVQHNELSGDAAGLSRSVTLAAAPTQGNLLIASFSNNGGPDSASWTFTGWTLRGEFTAIGNPKFLVWYKFAGAGESATVSASWTTTSVAGGMSVQEYSGVDATTPFDCADGTWSGTPTSTSFTVSPVTTVTADTLAVALVAGNSSTNTYTAPVESPTWTELYDFGAQRSQAGYNRTEAATGSYQPGNWVANTGSATQRVARMMMLRPTAGGGGASTTPAKDQHYRQMRAA